MDMMRQYGRLLENFNANDETVNDCIFTMMHHIAGDLRNVNVLLQPCILRVFLRIWKEGFELCVVSTLTLPLFLSVSVPVAKYLNTKANLIYQFLFMWIFHQ